MAKIMLDIMIVVIVYLVGYRMGMIQSDRIWRQSLDEAVKETLEEYAKKENKNESNT